LTSFHKICIVQSAINNPQLAIKWGGGVDISSSSGKEAWGEKKTFVKYRQNQPFDSPALDGAKG